jgi:hypothetical protein
VCLQDRFVLYVGSDAPSSAEIAKRFGIVSVAEDHIHSFGPGGPEAGGLALIMQTIVAGGRHGLVHSVFLVSDVPILDDSPVMQEFAELYADAQSRL